MTRFFLLSLFISFSLNLSGAELANEIYNKALLKLRESQDDHSALVPAVKLLTQASALFSQNNDEQKCAEVNACLYWAKKKLVMADIALLKPDVNLTAKLDSIEKPVAISDAQKWLDSAEAFAAEHTHDQLLTAIRYFEVADRFKETDIGRRAMGLCLVAMHRAFDNNKLILYQPTSTDGKALIKTEPHGAKIFLLQRSGGKIDTGKVTPSLVELPIGAQTIILSLPTHKAAALFVIIDGKSIAKPDPVQLELYAAQIDILSEEGWHVFLDGKPCRDKEGNPLVTPCTIEAAIGQHDVGLAKKGFVDIIKKIDTIYGGVKSPTGLAEVSLTIKAEPQRGISNLLKNAQPIVNVLSFVSLDKDIVSGNWKSVNGMLATDAESYARLELPYRPPLEYDVRVSFTRVRGNEGMSIFLTRDGKPFLWALGCYGNTLSYFELIAGVAGKSNPSTVRAGITTGQRQTLIIQVRDQGVKAILDNRPICEWKTDYADVSLSDAWRLRDPKLIGLASYQSAFIFHAVEVQEVRGVGQKMR